jgi:predicted dehydrogenase
MTATKRIGYAVVGLGSIAQSSVLPAFAHCKKAKLVALVGRDKKHATLLGEKYKVKAVYGSGEFAECLANPEVAAVYIATPQSSHLELSKHAAIAGKHVLCEKPLAVNVVQAEEMVQVCRAQGVQLMTAYRKYFEPSIRCIRKMVRDGALGRVDTVHCAFSELHVAEKSLAWLLDASVAGGGPLMDLGVYCVNTTRWLLGEDPVAVSAQSWRHDAARYTSVEEGISFRVEFPSGAILHGSTSYGAAISSLLFIQGSKGWVSLTPAFPFDEERHLTGKLQGRWLQRRFPIVDEFAPEIDAFAQAILSQRPVEPDGEQGLRDMKIMHAIYEATKQQQSAAIKY